VGFGIALLRQTLIKGPIEFRLFNRTDSYVIENIVIFTTLCNILSSLHLVVLIGTLIYVLTTKGVFNKKLGYTLVIVYGIFAFIVSIIAFTDAYIR